MIIPTFARWNGFSVGEFYGRKSRVSPNPSIPRHPEILRRLLRLLTDLGATLCLGDCAEAGKTRSASLLTITRAIPPIHHEVEDSF
jgi:hypothetical protein